MNNELNYCTNKYKMTPYFIFYDHYNSFNTRTCILEIYYFDSNNIVFTENKDEQITIEKVYIKCDVQKINSHTCEVILRSHNQGHLFEKLYIYDKYSSPNFFKFNNLNDKEEYDFTNEVVMSYNKEKNIFENKFDKRIFEIFDDWRLII